MGGSFGLRMLAKMPRQKVFLSFLFFQISSTYGWGPPPAPDLATALSSLRSSLESSVPPEKFHATIDSLQNSDKLTEHLKTLESLVTSRSAEGLKISSAASELAQLSTTQGGLRSANIGDIL